MTNSNCNSYFWCEAATAPGKYPCLTAASSICVKSTILSLAIARIRLISFQGKFCSLNSRMFSSYLKSRQLKISDISQVVSFCYKQSAQNHGKLSIFRFCSTRGLRTAHAEHSLTAILKHCIQGFTHCSTNYTFCVFFNKSTSQILLSACYCVSQKSLASSFSQGSFS